MGGRDRESAAILLTSVMKSCARHGLRKRDALIAPVAFLGVYAIFFYLYVVRDAPLRSLATLIPRFSGAFAIAAIGCFFYTPPPLRQAESLFLRFPLAKEKRRAILACLRILLLALLDLAFSPFFVKWGYGPLFLAVCLTSLSLAFAYFASRDVQPPRARRGRRISLPLAFNLTRFFCRPWIVAFVYPLACAAAIPLSSFIPGDASENRLAILLGAEFLFSILALFGADNRQKALFLLPYPVGYGRWQLHYHALSFLFLLPGRVAAFMVMGTSSGLQAWILRLCACDAAFLPFVFDPPFAVGALTVLPYFLVASLVASGHAWAIAAIPPLCALSLAASWKDYRDASPYSGGSCERIDRL